MSNKRFSKALSDQHDHVGKRIAVQIMQDLFKATLLVENTRETAGDFSAGVWDQKYRLPKGEEVFVDPEMKDKKWWGLGWDCSRPFKYDTVDIPFRKKKNKANIFMVISTCETYAWVVWRSVVEQHFKATGSQPINKYTIYEPDGGDYYRTPVNKGLFVCKKGDKWRKWTSKAVSVS